jgi:hypothetical protein
MLRPRAAHSPVIAVCGVALLALSGCTSAKTVTVAGKLVLPPKVKVAETDSVTVTFVRQDDPAAPGASATASPTGLTFEAAVQPGKYKISVRVQAYSGMKDSQQREKELTQQMASAPTMSYEVTSDAKQSITIDLVKGAVTKN